MSLTGDSLSILLFLASCAVACLIGALTAPKGWRDKTLWAGTALFAVAALVLLGRFPQLEAGPTLAVIAGLTPAVTVGVVALMLARRRPDPVTDPEEAVDRTLPAQPKRRTAEARNKREWTPNMSLHDVAIYVSAVSTWRPPYGRTIDAKSELRQEIRRKLSAGQVTAWGRAHPDGEEYQIAEDAWVYEADVRLDTSYAFFPTYGAPMHSIRLAKGEVEAAWPPKT